MEIDAELWSQLKPLAGRVFGSSLHFAMATINPDGTPHITPIGSLILTDPGEAYFDDSFFAFYEDLDLAWRARRAGWKAVYRHRAVGFHARGGTSRPRGLLTRVAAMLGRSPEIRYHIVKNRYLTLLRNDTVGAYLRNAPFIWGRDIATFVLLLVSSPTVLLRLWSHRALFAAAIDKRRLDTSRARHEVHNGISASGPDGVPSESKGVGPARGTDGSESE